MTTPTDWAAFPIRQLREECKARGISPGVRGSTKPGIVALLVEWEQAEAAEYVTVARDHAPMPTPEATPSQVLSHGSRLIVALETLWTAIRTRHEGLPEVLIRTGSGYKTGQSKVRLGHYHPGAWKLAQDEGRLADLLITGECLARGAEQVLGTMLHEAAHGMADLRGVKATTRGNAYHNRRFVELATELGLEWPEGGTPHKVRGFSAVKITDATVADYFMELVDLDMAINASMDTLERAGYTLAGDPRTTGSGTAEGGEGVTDERPKKKGMAKMVCKCNPKPRIIRVSNVDAETGGFHCTVCHQNFTREIS